MTFGDLMYKTGEAIQSSFPIFKTLKNSPNVIFITVLSVLFLWWCWKMMQYDKEAEKTGTMR